MSDPLTMPCPSEKELNDDLFRLCTEVQNKGEKMSEDEREQWKKQYYHIQGKVRIWCKRNGLVVDKPMLKKQEMADVFLMKILIQEDAKLRRDQSPQHVIGRSAPEATPNATAIDATRPQPFLPTPRLPIAPLPRKSPLPPPGSRVQLSASNVPRTAEAGPRDPPTTRSMTPVKPGASTIPRTAQAGPHDQPATRTKKPAGQRTARAFQNEPDVESVNTPHLTIVLDNATGLTTIRRAEASQPQRERKEVPVSAQPVNAAKGHMRTRSSLTPIVMGGPSDVPSTPRVRPLVQQVASVHPGGRTSKTPVTGIPQVPAHVGMVPATVVGVPPMPTIPRPASSTPHNPHIGSHPDDHAPPSWMMSAHQIDQLERSSFQSSLISARVRLRLEIALKEAELNYIQKLSAAVKKADK